ncbi:hypothetical protein Pmani_026179, partial [Petrolisthes manimaculis]
ASPPEKKKDALEEAALPPPPTSKNGQLSKQGSLTILRRSSSRTLSGRSPRHVPYTEPQDPVDSLDLLQDAVPSVDTPESCEKAIPQAACTPSSPQGWGGVGGSVTEEPPICSGCPRLSLHGRVQVSH